MPGKKWTYTRFIEELEKHGISIVETEEEFNAIVAAEKARDKKGKFEFKLCKFKFIYPDNKIESMQVCSWIKDKDKPTSERKAEKKEKLEARANDPENNSQAIEKKSIERIFEILDEKQDSNIDIKVVGLEGCHVDVAVRIKGSNENISCPIQIKSSNAEEIPQFRMERYKCPEEFKDKYERFGYYENMLTICHNMKIDKFLVIPPHSNDKIPDTCISYSSGVNKEFGVKKDEIYDRIIEYITNYSATLGKPYRELQLICNETCKLEVKHIHLRIDTFSNIFDMKEISGKAVDFIIDDSIKVQEKTVNYTDVSGNSFKFVLKKRDGGGKHQLYAIDDNDFYWFNLADTNYFYVIPSKLLERDGKIRNNLLLHKEFKIQEENKTYNYNDAWTYDFRFDRTKQDDIECLWNLIHS
ncbi:hypothetical protein JO84_gp292 [Aureococcus anophagefferens virus]|uniref:Uncharacterized protein n=1 Tax=Aureococcus anophagefferens virus TaxID=1474867 RepID=A0A076FG49_9VIRU|nr:hypothetical protein JO84_gp292 [Aureococcus anophagefferens virus]AII17000.1 hypothetical protein AaV_183 [Aureococcus anophagefferens virus]UOG94098.1 hypothetical protein MKD35_57 [Aureococcus anophagefferens virus]